MPLFGSKEKLHCRVLLLDDSDLSHEISSKTKGYELLDKVFNFLNLLEKDYFGLRYRDRDDQTKWLDSEKSIKKQIHNAPPYTLYFGVKFYAADPTKLSEELTRYQFFLQLKKDMLQGRLPCNFNVATELCSYAVQSELGDYDASLHVENYVSEFRFLPSQSEELESKITDIHKKLRGQVPAEAEANFLERVKWLEMYGVDLYPVKGQDNVDYFLGLTPTGIVLFKNKNKIGSFIWPKITKLKFKSDTFIVRANQGKNDDEKEFTFVLTSKQAAKTLWRCCAEHHTFFRLEKAKDLPSSAYNFLFRKGSGFRFSGRTQREIIEDNERMHRPAPAVRRVQSKRYGRRNSTEVNPNPGNRARNGSAKRYADPEYTTSVGKDQGSYHIAADPADSAQPPWEQRPNSQGGLYTNGKRPQNAPEGIPITRTAPSPRFPHPSENSTTVISGDIEMPRRKVSTYQSGYVSEDPKRKRSHYYSGYTSASDAESIFKPSMRNKTGSEPNVMYRTGESRGDGYHRYEDPQQQMYYRRRSRESLHEQGYDSRGPDSRGPPPGHGHRHRPSGYQSGSKSDSEQANRDRRRIHYNQQRRRHQGGVSDSEMVPALDVRQASIGLNARKQHVQHRHHQHRSHPQGMQYRQSRGLSYDPNNAKVLLELGPESGHPSQPVYHGDPLHPVHLQQPPGQTTHVIYQHPDSRHVHVTPPSHMPNPRIHSAPPGTRHVNMGNPHYAHRFPPEQYGEPQQVNRYMQQYLPPRLVRNDRQPEMNGQQFVEQVISPTKNQIVYNTSSNNNHINSKGPQPITPKSHDIDRPIISPDVTSNYSISTEL